MVNSVASMEWEYTDTMNLLGELAALATSISFTFGSTFFTLGARVLGSIAVNRLRLLIAISFLMLTHWIFFGVPYPIYAEPYRWLWLGLSGIVGYALGDFFLFQAFVWIGPRLSMLMMSLAPVIATFLAWVFLGETITLLQMVGVLITLSGVGWVVLDRSPIHTTKDKDYGRGVFYALLGAMGQAGGLVLAKNGLSGDFSPISANIIRMTAGAGVLWGIAILQKEVKETLQKVFEARRGIAFTMVGSFAGPFVGVTFSMLAIQNTDVGIASTLMALPPVFLLPIGYFFFKERYGWGAVVGTFLAIAGVAIIFLV